jgi:predicted esterase
MRSQRANNGCGVRGDLMKPIFYKLTGVVLAVTFAWVLRAYAGGSDLFARDAQDQLPQGEVIEKVTCNADPSQSYALFLPSGYTPGKKWPVLYAFDPGARGSVPVKLFREAAEKFGYIVVGSNNSRNGIDITAIVKTLWADTHERFSIDERRVYTTGFSGGARVASAVALSYRDAVAGAIVASGGPRPNFNPSSASQLVFFVTAGTEDFNFPEMQQLKRRLDALSIPNRLVIFAGGHEWPGAAVCGEAITWLEVQAMKSGTRTKDDALIDERLKSQTKTAQDYEASQKNYEAYLEYEALVMQFRGLRDVNEFAARAARLKASKDVKAAIKGELTEENDQAKLLEKLETLLRDATTNMETMAELKANLSDLAKQADDTRDVAERRVAHRVLQALRVQMYEEAFALRQRKEYASIPPKLELAAVISPKDPRVFYDLATAYARVGNKSRATTALGKAIERGFSDLARIEENEDFAILRNEAEYKKLIAGLKKS